MVVPLNLRKGVNLGGQGTGKYQGGTGGGKIVIRIYYTKIYFQ